jgi:hypothetical protein
MGRVIVLHASSPGHARPEWEQDLLLRLPYARRLELEARDPQSRRASLRATVLLFEAASRLGLKNVGSGDLRFPEGGKPVVTGGPYYSVSHTRGRIACAASRDCDVGLDHEEYVGEEPPARLTHWTAIEATLKAAGAGLRRARRVEIDPEFRFSRLDGTRYDLVPLDLGTGVVACLAASSRPDEIAVLRIEGVGE